MVVKRISASAWAALAFVAVVDMTACDGESTTSSDDDEGGTSGSDANGGTGDRGGASGTGGSTGGRGGTAGRGGSPTGGSSGDAGAGGTSGDAGEAGTAGQGGVAGDAGGGGDAGAGDGGLAGDAGGGPMDMTVQGRLVDFWLTPLPNVPVTIGTTTVATDATGTFTIPDVPPQYDASLVVSWPGGQAGIYGWLFEGLTRRDPILQVYKGLPNRSTSITLDPQGETLDSSRTLSIALGGPNGFYQEFDDVSGNGISTFASWVGPTSATASIHALLWERDSNDLPIAFRSYDTTTTTLVDPTPTPTIALSLADESIGQVMLAGNVTSPSSLDRTNHVYARFTDGAVIRVVEDVPPPANFGYLAPTLPNSSSIVAASYGTSFFGEYSISHRSVPSTGESNIALEILTPVAQVAPASGVAGVNASTQFSWSGRNSVYLFHAENVLRYEGFFVVTTRRSITLPNIPGFSLRAGDEYNWRVETHGQPISVDAVAGAEGFLDAFGVDDDRPLGRYSGGGSYTISTGRVFTTATN